MFYQKFIEHLSDNTNTAEPKIEPGSLLQNIFEKCLTFSSKSIYSLKGIM